MTTDTARASQSIFMRPASQPASQLASQASTRKKQSDGIAHHCLVSRPGLLAVRQSVPPNLKSNSAQQPINTGFSSLLAPSFARNSYADSSIFCIERPTILSEGRVDSNISSIHRTPFAVESKKAECCLL